MPWLRLRLRQLHPARTSLVAIKKGELRQEGLSIRLSIGIDSRKHERQVNILFADVFMVLQSVVLRAAFTLHLALLNCVSAEVDNADRVSHSQCCWVLIAISPTMP